MLNDFYQRLVEDPAPLNEAAQHSIVSRGRNGDDALLASLVARPDAAPFVLDAARTSKSAKVRAAYWSRPGHSEQQLIAEIGNERRVTVLASIAELPGTSPALLTALAADGRRGVSVAVLGNDNTPAAVKKDLILALAGNWAAQPHPVRERVIGAIEQFPGDLDELLSGDYDSTIQHRVLCHGRASFAATIAWLDANVKAPLSSPTTVSYTANSASRFAQQLMMRTTNPEVVEYLVSLRPLVASASRGTIHAFDAALEQIAKNAPDAVDARNRAATSTDSAELEALGVAAVDAGDRDVASQLMNNRATPMALLRRIAAADLTDTTSLLQAAERTADDTLVIAALNHTPHNVSDDLLAKTTDPQAILRTCVEGMDSAVSRTYNRAFERRILGSSLCDETVMAAFPWTSFARLCADAAFDTPERAWGYVAATLGDEPETWRLFDQLGDHFVGTTGELLETCTRLAAELKVTAEAQVAAELEAAS